MKVNYRVLVVDDQYEVRRMLRSGLETLGPEFEIIAIPSAEEALLEAMRRPPDLLISDVRLAGMSGLELKKKIQARNPSAKVIMITGVTDTENRSKVEASGADAYFYKPIEFVELLEAVRRCLGVKRPPSGELSAPTPPRKQGLVEGIADLRVELNAVCTAIFNDQGQALAVAGNLPTDFDQPRLRPLLSSLLSSGAAISHTLGKSSPEDLYYFSGETFFMALTHIGHRYVLLAIGEKPGKSQLPIYGQRLVETSRKLHTFFLNTGILGQTELSAPPPIPLELEEEALAEQPREENLEALTELFEGVDQENLDPQEVEAFWDSLPADERTSPELTSADALTYDQARKLGLTPDEEKDEAG